MGMGMVPPRFRGSADCFPAMILAGGRATRMGGGDKPLLPLHGRPLLAHIVERLGPLATPVALNANGNPARFAAFGLPVFPDPVPGHPGPLAGILAAMRWAASLGAPLVLTVAGDTPFIPTDLATRLAAASGGEHPVVAASATGLHPVIGLWPAKLAGQLADALATGEHKVGAWATAQGAIPVMFAGGPPDPFANLNAPADLADAEAWLAGSQAAASATSRTDSAARPISSSGK